MWYEMENRPAAEGTELTADIRIPSESPWFGGHFPGNPVLPGIAQIGMVFDLIRQHADHPIRLVEVGRVRFKQMILPDDRLRVTASPKRDHNGVYLFRIFKAEELAASGVIAVAQRRKKPMQTGSNLDGIILRIAEIMINELKLEDVTAETFDPDMDLVDEVGIDSMDLATVALVLRDEYAVRIDEDDYPKLTTIRLISHYIHNKLDVAA
jgi:acyl carrier protein